MGQVTEQRDEAQERRRLVKQLGQQMKRVAVEGTGISPWEADVLVETIEEVYFRHPELRTPQPGQVLYSCVAADEGSGKPLHECRMASVWLTLFSEQDRGNWTNPRIGEKGHSIDLRRRRLIRLTEQAHDQGGLLSQEDLAQLLMTDVRTIRRDIRALREDDDPIVVRTRGQQQDIGPGVTHRALVVRLWLEGLEPADVAKRTKHSLSAVENYLEKFKRVAYLRGKSFGVHETALTVGISLPAVRAFSELYEKYRHTAFWRQRLAEVALVGHEAYLAADEKKDSRPSNAMNNARRRP